MANKIYINDFDPKTNSLDGNESVAIKENNTLKSVKLSQIKDYTQASQSLTNYYTKAEIDNNKIDKTNILNDITLTGEDKVHSATAFNKLLPFIPIFIAKFNAKKGGGGSFVWYKHINPFLVPTCRMGRLGYERIYHKKHRFKPDTHDYILLVTTIDIGVDGSTINDSKVAGKVYRNGVNNQIRMELYGGGFMSVVLYEKIK